MLNSIMILDRIYLFWANVAPKIKIVSLRWNLVHRRRLEYAEFDGDLLLFFSLLEILFLGKIGPENQNCVFRI